MRNQRGQSILLMVTGISAFLIALPLGLTAYWKNNLVAAARVREAYNLMNAIEQAARDVRADWDISAGTISPVTATNAIQTNVNATTGSGLMTPGGAAQPNPACAGACQTLNTTSSTPILCYPNPSNSAAPYCFFGTLMSPNAMYIELKVRGLKSPDFLERTGYKIAKALDYLHLKKNNSGLFESRALAAITARTDNTGPNLGCTAASGAPCMTCGAAAPAPANQRPCTLIFTCPASFPACAAFDGTPATAIFSQQFFILPNNDQN